MGDSLIQHVSDTAFLVAHHRAVESARPDALFSDPLAGRLAGERGAAVARGGEAGAMTGWMVAMRTPVIDTLVDEAIRRGVDTVVNLGAGLDTRPYRLELPATLTWIEVDYPELIAFKDQHLRGERPRCRLERIGLDLADGPARRQLLGRLDAAASRMLVLTEGVIPYLDEVQVGALADDLRALQHVETWIADYVSPEAVAYRKRLRRKAELRNVPFRFEPPDWFAFFAAHGWKAGAVRYLADESARVGRPVPFPWPLRLLLKVLGPITPPERKQRMARFAGYVALVPAPA